MRWQMWAKSMLSRLITIKNVIVDFIKSYYLFLICSNIKFQLASMSNNSQQQSSWRRSITAVGSNLTRSLNPPVLWGSAFIFNTGAYRHILFLHIWKFSVEFLIASSPTLLCFLKSFPSDMHSNIYNVSVMDNIKGKNLNFQNLLLEFILILRK